MSERHWDFRHRLTVRFSDCDLLGHVNNAVYLTYFEECRVAWWRHLGSPFGMPGVGAILVHASCNYRAPAHFSDELEVRLAVAGLGNSSVTTDHEIVHAASGRLVADGRTVIVAYDYDAEKTVPLPDETRRLLAPRPESA
ncbi:MAG: acyl-CoA thioesterase [Acidobacteria bacterium]|nr:acyl-CoA thioesterase [Acidobacteriota bacterium]